MRLNVNEIQESKDNNLIQLCLGKLIIWLNWLKKTQIKKNSLYGIKIFFCYLKIQSLLKKIKFYVKNFVFFHVKNFVFFE